MRIYDKGGTITDQCAHRIMSAVPDPDWHGCTVKEEFIISYHEEGLYSVHDKKGTICALVFARNPNEAIEKLREKI